jgi:lysophospholipid acyltransferase (LPLAT)-like uncharacterized protein
MVRSPLLAWLVYLAYRLWSFTWRVECIESPGLTEALKRGEPLIFAHWHGQELCILPLIPRYRIATMTSTSKDGQLIDFAIRKLGGATSRGSSTRGGIGALKGLVRLVRGGYRASMAVDGPKGPLHKAKPGVFELARLAQARIVALGAACSREHVFARSWNQAQLPLPFSKVKVWFGEPWEPLSKEDLIRSPEMAERLEAQISKACQHALEHLR